MIESYFLQIEQTIREFPNVRYLSLTKKIYNASQGYINGSIIFENNHRLDFIEVKNTDTKPKIKYRYHYMNEAQVMSSVMIMHPILLKLLVFPIINTRLMTLKKALSQVLSKCF